ncbi:hypothetical protein P43SY_007626 [Pythium insidiosum]|uniref:Thaumatin-like protein n=1 Tax=Pythium insidiosum TaxID=114742 RepID=A0AAD5M1R2_PYTIN|nr:hypothetical protein P43SY_007626 [Pythium insidiosum]
MVLSLRSTLAALAVLGAASSAQAATLTFKNACPHPIELFERVGGKYGDIRSTIECGASTSKQIGKGYEGHFRHGQDDAATLAEFSTKGDMPFVWHDISIIPPRLNKGFEFCKSLDECKKNSQSKKGFNVPLQIKPTSNVNGKQCRTLTCEGDYCDDAYQFPKDDTKTHACPMDTDFVITFCPGGNSPEPAQPESKAPETKAPEPTTKAPEPATKAPEPITKAPEPTPTMSPTVVPATPAPATSPPAPAPAPATTAPAKRPTPDDESGDGKQKPVAPTPVQTQAPAPTQAPTQAPTPAATQRKPGKGKHKHCV